MLKTYLVAVVTIIIALALFGVILPMLFSAKSNEAVLVGGFIVVILPVIAVGAFKMFKGDSK